MELSIDLLKTRLWELMESVVDLTTDITSIDRPAHVPLKYPVLISLSDVIAAGSQSRQGLFLARIIRWLGNTNCITPH